MALCPGSWQMQQGLPEEETPEAAEGTAIHKGIETGDTSGLSEDAAEVVRRGIEARSKIVGDNPYESEVELRVVVPVGSGVHEIVGHGDTISADGDRGIVLDYKTHRHGIGAQLVAVQQGCYAAGRYARNPELKSVDVRVLVLRDDIEYATTYRAEQMEALSKRLGDIVYAGVYSEVVVLKPSKDACQYCKAKRQCPAAMRAMDRLPALANSYELASPAYRAEILERAKVVKGIAESVEKAAKAALEADPEAVEGWEIAERRGHRKIRDINMVVNLLRGRLSPDQILPIMSLPPSALERLWCEGRENRAEAKRELWALIGEYVGRGKSSRVLQRKK